MREESGRRSAKRALVQWALAPITIIVIALGWKYPLLGFTVPIVMLVGIIGGVINGRYVCGHLCPRGGFYDRMVSKTSRSSRIPDALRSMPLRWILVALLMGFMVYRISLNPGDVYHWGRVFWLMCVVTTGIGVVLGVLIHQRTWCSVCPIGTMANAFGGGKNRLRIDSEKCLECRVCEKACPINLPIVDSKPFGVLQSRDCLKCPECVAACPRNVLSWESSAPGDDRRAAEEERVLAAKP